MLQIINNPKTIQSFSTLNAEKVSKLNNLILDSMTSFNTKYKEINDNLMELKLEFLNHINSVQSLLNGNDEEDIIFNSDNLSLEKENFSPSSFKKNIGKNEEKNCLILKNDDKDIEEKFERNLERKKTFNQILRKDYKLSSILFNRDRRDDITKKNVTFHPEQVFKENTPGRKIKKKNKENKENKENKNLNENNKINNNNENNNNKENNNKNKNNNENNKNDINKENNNNNENNNKEINNNENNKNENINNEKNNNLSNNNLININENNPIYQFDCLIIFYI